MGDTTVEEIKVEKGKKKIDIVFETKDLNVIPVIMEMIRLSKVEGIDLNEIELFIRTNIGKRDTKLWVVFDGEKVKGFLLAYVVFPFVAPEVFIAWVYTNPGNTKASKLLYDAVERWARRIGIKKLSAIVRDNLKAFEKAWGFKLEYYTVSKEIIPKEDDNNVRII